MKNIFYMHNGKEMPTLEPRWSTNRLLFRSRMLAYTFGLRTPDSRVIILGLQELGRDKGELIDFEIWTEE